MSAARRVRNRLAAEHRRGTSRIDPRWRGKSNAVGPFGLYGPGRDFDNAQHFDGDLVTKVPAIVEGRTAVTVRVPQAQPNRVLLHYSGHRPIEALTFDPCGDQAITSWPGALVLESRQPATVEVQVGDTASKTARVG